MKVDGKNIVLGVTGGIAAYKAVELVSSLKKQGANIFVIMTKNACNFVAPLTFETLSGNRVICDMFDRSFSWEVEHISLAKKADVFVVVPATANFIGKAANGIADDMLTTTVMATKAPVLVAPAMNTGMYENIAVIKNIQKLKNRGYSFVEPFSGYLACGDTGKGKLADISVIEDAIKSTFTEKDLKGLKILVTAGPTRESLDPVRFISNNSTGKMGYAIAKSAENRGAEVTLVSGPVSIKAPNNVKLINVMSAVDMYDVVMNNLKDCDIVIKAAAVGDYRPQVKSDDKIKKNSGEMVLQLCKNPDILSEIGLKKRDNQTVCGFSMETRDLIENSTQKLIKKNCDLIVANNLKVEGAGFGVDTNVVTLLYKEKQPEKLQIMKKEELSDVILNKIMEIHKNK